MSFFSAGEEGTGKEWKSGTLFATATAAQTGFPAIVIKGRRLGTTGVGVTALASTIQGELPLLAALFDGELHGFGDGTEAVDELDQADILSDLKDEVLKAVSQGVSCGGHLRLEVVPSPADAISMAYHLQKRKA